MRYARIYADAKGQSHFEDVEVQAAEDPRGSVVSGAVRAASVQFRQFPPTHHNSWHNAPRRQFVITLSGEAEVEASDGEVRRMGSGSILLAEDLTGKGHITRGVGSTDRITLAVPLEDQTATEANQGDIRSLEDRRFQAMIAADVPALEQLLGDQLVYTHSSARVDTKTTLIEDIRTKRLNYQKIERSQEVIQVYGGMAVVSGQARIELLAASGTMVLNLRYVDVWTKGAKGWQMVAWQSTPIAA